MFDLDVLELCRDKEKYERFSPYVKEHIMSPDSWKIFQDMGVWFDKYDELEWPGFRTWFKMVRLSDSSKAALYDIIFTKLEGHTIEPDVEKELSEHLVAKDYATNIAEKALAVSEGDIHASLDDVIVLIEKYESEIDRVGEMDKVLVTSDIHEIIAATTGGSGLDWRLDNLNEALGPLRKGDFVVVGARPDSGKTSFISSEATNFLSQLDDDKYVLWFNNEEGGAKVRSRTIQSGINWNSEEIQRDPLGAVETFEKECGSMDRFIIVDDAGMPNWKMEWLMKKYDPGAIIFDQLWKVPGFEKESANEVGRQTMLFNWGREMAKRYAPVITVHQAGGTAGGERWLPMEALYGSQTGIQGEADAIIMLGRSYDPADEEFRFFYIPKNKMYGKSPMHRNGKFIATIDTTTGRFSTDGSFEL